MTAALLDKTIFYCVYTLSVAYLVLYVAYVPNGVIRGYNNLGDYSYGIYLLAFPIQQSVATLIPRISPLQMFMISFAVTAPLAILSWHFVEKYALGLKSYYIGRTRRILNSDAAESNFRENGRGAGNLQG